MNAAVREALIGAGWILLGFGCLIVLDYVALMALFRYDDWRADQEEVRLMGKCGKGGKKR